MEYIVSINDISSIGWDLCASRLSGTSLKIDRPFSQ